MSSQTWGLSECLVWRMVLLPHKWMDQHTRRGLRGLGELGGLGGWGGWACCCIYPMSAQTSREKSSFIWILGNQHKWWWTVPCWLTFSNLMVAPEGMALAFPQPPTPRQRRDGGYRCWRSSQWGSQVGTASPTCTPNCTYVQFKESQFHFRLLSEILILENTPF